MESSRRLLSCMEYPFFSTVDLSSRVDYIHLVTWLEDTKIRFLEIAERKALRQDSDTWDVSFSDYLNSLDCPFVWPLDSKDCLTWLISHSIAAEYENCADTCREVSAEQVEVEVESDAMIVDDNIVPEVDVESDSNMFDIDSIGTLLGLNRMESETNPGIALYHLHLYLESFNPFESRIFSVISYSLFSTVSIQCTIFHLHLFHHLKSVYSDPSLPLHDSHLR